MSQPYASITQQMLQAFQSQHLEAAERFAKMILKMNARDLVALQVFGLSLAMQGRVAESVMPLYKASQQDQKNPELLSNLAKAQHGAAMYADAILTYKKLDHLIPNNPQILTDLATSLAKSKLYDEAVEIFDRAIEVQPGYFLAWSNRGNLLSELRLCEDAIKSYQRALELNPGYAEAWTNYGNALFGLSRYEEARSAHKECLRLDPNFGEAWLNYGNTLLELKLEEEAFDAYERAYNLNPAVPYLMGQYFAAKTNQCIWDESPSVENFLDLVSGGHKVTIPFNLLQTNASLAVQRIAAEIFSKDRFPKGQSPLLVMPTRATGKKIRVGYFSSDFREHPVGILIQNIITIHDRSQFEVYGFFLNSKTGDSVEKGLANSFDKIFNLHGISDPAAIDLIIAEMLDIAVDLNGHTSGARTALFAKKIASVQVNYLGYAGTSGTFFYDALIADEIVIPKEHQIHYSEPIAYLPNSFFPVDTSIAVDSFGNLPAKSSQGLPEDSFIFACFNNAYKITPQIFDVWMRLLKEVPRSVLWLSKPSSEAMLNLQKEAENRGVDPGRLIFATRTPGRTDHLSRLRLADLFLDTPNYNAHATAADALWAGLPVLTQIGNTFAGRVAASQISALGQSELIAHSEGEYVARALAFANHPETLKPIRQHLEASRASSALFNTKQYVKDLESVYIGLLKKG